MMEERWGTRTEMILGFAVVRLGTAAWGAVAAELRTRSPFPFTSEECKAKFEDLQARYPNCNSLTEELRKRRIAELKKESERAKTFISSLESNIVNLTLKRGIGSKFHCTTKTLLTPENVDGINPPCKAAATIRNGPSSSSRSRLQKHQNLKSVSFQEENLMLDLDLTWTRHGKRNEFKRSPQPYPKIPNFDRRRKPACKEAAVVQDGSSTGNCSADGIPELVSSEENDWMHSFMQYRRKRTKMVKTSSVVVGNNLSASMIINVSEDEKAQGGGNVSLVGGSQAQRGMVKGGRGRSRGRGEGANRQQGGGGDRRGSGKRQQESKRGRKKGVG